MKRNSSEIIEKKFDILIIGGGITGAAIAYEAASRGFSVALFEKSDFGGATSAATSKMIHGGLRYLAKMEFKLVRESLRERRILTNIAPNFVHPAPFLLTSYKNGKTPAWMLTAAMILYDLLSYDKKRLRDKSKKMPVHKSISKNKALKLEPNIKSERLQRSQIYYDCLSFSPERLTLAFIKSAVAAGAKVMNYAEVKGFLFDEKRPEKAIAGLKIVDKTNEHKFSVFGKYVVNCSGPWADIVVNKAFGIQPRKILRRSEGIHLITKKLVNKYVVTAITKSGRHCFIVPWRGHTIIGTTDEEFRGNPDDYKVTKKAVSDFLKEVNVVFGRDKKLKYSDVQFVYGGMRPLIEDQTENVYESSRKYEIVDHAKEGIFGFITVEGGKYTTGRSLAENAVNYLFKISDKNYKPSDSKLRFLKGSEIENFLEFVTEKQILFPEFEPHQIEFLCKMYGTDVDAVLKLVEEKQFRQKLNSDGEIGAQIVYALQNEMALKLSDILFRRTGIGTLGHPGKETLDKVANIAANMLNWDETKKQAEINEVENIFKIPEN